MAKEPEIRRAAAADARAVGKCVEAAYRHYTGRIGKPPGPMLDDYAEVIRSRLVFVAEAEKIVGVLVLIETAQNVLLDNVAVDPECQGRGLGKRLVALAESEARRRGYDRLELYTHELMHENLELYRSLGYSETARRREQGYDRIYMQKKLGG